MASIYDMSDLWDNGSTTYTSIKMNVTDTASASASLLMDLQTNTGGAPTSRFSVRRDGYVVAASALFGSGANGIGLNYTTGSLLFGASIRLEWGSTGINSPDLFLTRRGTANLRFGNVDAAAPVPQTLSVQSVVAGTSNGAGANFTITGSQGTGSGAGGSIIFQVAPANGGGGATVQNPLSTALTINSAQQVSIQSAGTAAAPTLVWSGDTTTGFYKSTGNIVDFSAGGAQAMRFSSNGFFFTTSAGKMVVSSAGAFGFSSGTAGGAGEDVLLVREAAAVAGVRGANSTTGGALSFIEQTAPAAPAANGVRIYAEDNGAGKTRLMARFATGAAQEIAIEP
jgi:hypothetical protein